MKQEDNINNFFKKNLGDTTPDESGWNIPSDDIWNRAKAEFPKKKRRKPFIFFLLGLGSILVIGITFYYLAIPKQIIAQEKKEFIIANTKKLPHSNENLGTENIETDHPENSTNSNIAVDKNIAPSKTNIDKSQNLAIENKKLNGPKFQTAKSKAIKSPESIDKNIEINNIISSNKLAETPLKNELEKTKTLALNPISSPEIEIELEDRSRLNIVKLPILLPKLKTSAFDKTPEALTIIKPRRVIHRWELGVSHSPLMIDLESLVETDGEEESDRLNVGLRYLNFNIPVSRRLNRRFSLSSGISLTKIDIDLDFSTTEIFDFAETGDNFKSLLRKKSSAGSLTINDVSTEVGIEFTQNANLMNGDTVVVEGAIPIKLSAVQIPLLLNYHFGRGKVEGLLHTGISIDYLKSAINTLDFKVYKDDILITEPVNFTSIKDDTFDIGIYFGVGMKYHINDDINFGLSAKLDFKKLPLSRFELGMYYGF